MSALAIETDELVKTFGATRAVDGVDLAVPRGAVYGVLGPNGAGKTTTIRMLATLLRPDGGTARVLGRDVAREGWAVRGRIGLLGHDPLLYRELSARENLRFHARLHGVGAERVDALLAQAGLADRADEPVRTLSRGLVQRVAVCRAVLHDPPLLLLDEPRANLDPRSAELVEPLLGRAPGRTRIVTSHDPRGGLAEADVALGLRAGRPALLRAADAVTPDDIGALYA